jgi:hypothetical protein
MRQLLRITATFALAFVFTAGVAFGQQEGPFIDQAPGDVDPDDANNFAQIDQQSDDNFAQFEQLGSGNLGLVDQSGDDGNIADVLQDGDNNTVRLPTQGGSFRAFDFRAEAEIDQIGDRNYVGVAQGGNDKIFESFLDVRMEGDDNFLGNPDGGVTSQQGGKLYADIVGDRNRIEILAEQTQSKADFDIDGSDNTVESFQKSATSGFDLNPQILDVEIDGSGNTVDALQGNFTAFNNRAFVDIDGGTNTVDVTQGARFPGDPASSSNNFTQIDVDGSGNTANVTQQAE